MSRIDGLPAVGRSPAALLGMGTFRLAIGACLILCATLLLQFGLIAWNTSAFEAERIGRITADELRALARSAPDELRRDVGRRFGPDLRALPVVALFGRDESVVAGDLTRLPPDLALDGIARRMVVSLVGGRRAAIRAAAIRLGSGEILLVGRELREIGDLRRIALDASLASFLPALILSLAGGAVLGYRTLVRIRAMHRTIERIVDGGFAERLELVSRSDDELSRLAGSVNRMLDRIEQLMADARSVGDDIAHDLRTPLSHVRATLERVLDGGDIERMRDGVERALEELERLFATITALLRIAELETLRRTAGFAPVSLAEIARDAVELYEPVAEAGGISLQLADGADAVVVGDRHLLIEALANLIDNAIKFSVAGGHVLVIAGSRGGTTVLAVEDDGIGIDAAEQALVFKRFHRADRARTIAGSGLGLSLVAAIASLHGASAALTSSGGGCRALITFGGDVPKFDFR